MTCGEEEEVKAVNMFMRVCETEKELVNLYIDGKSMHW